MHFGKVLVGCPLLQILSGMPSKAVLKRFSTILVNIIHTCHVGFRIVFHPLKMLWVVVEIYPHVNLEQEPVTLCRSVHMGSRVPSPTHVSKSQHGGKVPTFEPQESIKIRYIIIEVGP